MTRSLLCFAVFRIAFPTILTICALLRPSVLSGIYLMFLYYHPYVPLPTTSTLSGRTGIYLKFMMIVSGLTTLSQAAFQVFLLVEIPYGDILKNCAPLERILRTIGYVKLNELPPKDVLEWTYPEPLMLLSSIATYWFCKKLVYENPNDLESMRSVPKRNNEDKYIALLTSIGRYGVLVTMCFAAIIRPSVFGGLYFIIFLSSVTWWSCYRKLERKFAVLLRCIMVVVLLHMTLLYVYQIQWPQDFLPPENLISRLFGLVRFFSYNCTNPRYVEWVENTWDIYAYPIALYQFYILCIYESRLLMKPQLMKGMSPSRKYGSSGRKSSLIQDSVGSVTVPSDAVEDIPMDRLDIPEEGYNPTICENVMYVLEAILQVIIKSSYIGTNIIMMTWSITYLSWITFVLLLWANLIWLIPNQRKAMLRSSPFLLFYAWFLLISAYVFCMDLTNEELPSSIQNVNLAQIGFVKITKLPFTSLAVKCLFTAMFCITLRQYMQERVAERQNSALADMVAPLQVTVDAAAGVEKEPETTTLDNIGKWFRTFMASIWIWIVAITLFCVSITGQRMTGFRIVYMGLFLIFVVTFQLSYRFWKKIIYGFWLIVIIYSMLMLILVYTYQFDHFPDYWSSLGLPLEQQEDLGLERYETTQLFVRLVTPTFFIIITVIQLHYFHDDFMSIYEDSSNEIKTTNEVQEDESERRRDGAPSSVKFNVSDLESHSLREARRTRILKAIKYYWNLLFLFLEIHMVKFVLLIGILACLIQPCAMDFLVVLLLILGTVLGKRMEPFAIYSCSVFFSALLLARMVYQIKYFRASDWEFNCSNGNGTNRTVNDAEWLGFSKVDENKSLMYFIRWDIIYIIVTTLWTTVNIRQMNLRSKMGIPHARVEVMFPSITRADADKDLSNFFKYLLNYGFYKFGVELCLFMTVALIGFRMDLYALLYAFWLCGLFTMRRETMSNIWNVFIFFIACLIPFQYCMVIGLPSSLCIIFPWDTNDILKKFQEWAFLIDTFNGLPAKKLICDYLLLLLVSRQAIGFKKEVQQRTMGLAYPGGSNDVIIQHSEDPNFENPVPDFITFCRSYLDVFKRAVLLSMLWLTLAVLFLAGTNRVNIFSIGYLIGAFVFLWTGTDMYLWPIPKILKRWNFLITYNVCVITIKAGLQIVGCLFMEELTDSVCWPVQLFAIGCVNKFEKNSHLISDNIDAKCVVPREYIGLVWDGLSFACLIIQRRIFHSYNFFHMIDEAKASTILASRGAELIEELRLKRMREQEENERVVLEKIKSKMDRIKASQQKIQGAIFREPKTHHLAIRSGDYYMFDDLHVEDLDPLDALPTTSLADDVHDDGEEEEYEVGYTVGEFLSTAMKTNIGSTVRRASISAEQARRRSSKSRIQLSESVSRIDVKSVKIQDVPMASTSRDEGMSEFVEPDEDSAEDTQVTIWQRIKDVLVFVYIFLDSIMISATKFLNSYTRDYRYVFKVLRREKKNLKEYTNYSVGKRVGRSQIWEPDGSFHQFIGIYSKSISLFKILEEEEAEMSSYDQPTILKFLLALWYIVTSKSELMCYLIIFLNQIHSATFLSLALPLMVFLWGTLTMPRPTKTFWVSIIAYTEVIVLIKCMFQFDIIPWNRKSEVVNGPLYPPRIIGIERKHNYALWDLLLLLVVFFHRFMLKSMGLWQGTTPNQKTIPGYYKIDESGNLTHLQDRRNLSRTETRSLSSLNRRFRILLSETTITGGSIKSDVDSFHRRGTFLHRLFNNFRMFGYTPDTSVYTDYATAQDQGYVDEIGVEREESSEKVELTDDELNSVVRITTHKIDPVDNLTETLKLAAKEYIDTFRSFFTQLIQPTSRIAADVYSYMFLCDFFNFFVLLLGYTSFGANQGDGGGVTSYLEDNKIPVLFLLMLIIQFMLIIIDRGIYLRKNLVLKIIFQYFLVIFLHLWLFVLYPTITERSFNSVIPPQMYYMIKCFYLLLSAYQIRCGYPTRILGNFLCKGYNYVNMGLFRVFLAVPFLFELRTAMDWMWTDTSMTFFDWVKMEDIFAHIFVLKCQRYLESEYPQPRGEKKKNLVKYIMGGGILLFIIGIIWFPLVFFSLGNAVGKPNIPFDVTMDLRIGPYDPVYQMSAQDNNIYQFDTSDYYDMLNTYDTNRNALTFITNYEAPDVAAVKLSSDSSNVWTISPPDRIRMIEEVKSNNSLLISLNYKVSHKTSKSEDAGIISSSVRISLKAFGSDGQRNPARTNLSLMLEDKVGNVTTPVLLKDILPKFLKVTNNGVVKPVGNLMNHIAQDDNANFYRNVTLNLHHSPDLGPQSDWWKMNESCNDKNYNRFLSHLPYQDCDSIVIYIFNDKIFPAGLSILTSGGIIGLYTLYFFLAVNVVRSLLTNGHKKLQCIWYEDIPNPDRIYVMLNYIYILRAYRLYDFEEMAYSRLLFVMRSRELCIKMTRVAGDPYDPNVLLTQHQQGGQRGYGSIDYSERYLH